MENDLEVLVNLLSDELLSLPKVWHGNDFIAYIQHVLERYNDRLCLLRGGLGDRISPRLDSVRCLSKSILDALRTVSDETISDEISTQAVDLLAEGINAIKDELFYVATCNTAILQNQYLYRIRSSATPLQLRRDMFHIPFEYRYRAKPYRYSVAGYPCLYVANSVYLCWLECNQPDFSTYYVSRFELDRQGLNVLDLSNSPLALAENLDTALILYKLGNDLDPAKVMNSPLGDDWTEYVKSFLISWPLIAACTICVRDPDANKKPEYYIPQLLMSWVQKTADVAGVRYFTTKEDRSTNSNDFAINYALPTKILSQAGYDNFLKKHVKCTSPLSVAMFSKKTDRKSINEEAVQLAESRSRRVYIVEGNIMQLYFDTLYCDIEYELDKYEVAYIEAQDM